MEKWKVYLSSTYNDLKEWRVEIRNLFERELSNKFELSEIMEKMYDRGNHTPFLDDCIAAVKDCDIYILILGNTTGSFPPGENRPYTEIEMETALSERKFFYCFRLENFNAEEIENKEKHQNILDKFRGKPTHVFNNIQELKSLFFSCLIGFSDKSPINKANPYKGLAAFDVEDGKYFFGRESEVEEFFKYLSTNRRNPLISIVGDSGIGKSSFVQAGILYRMKNDIKLNFNGYKQIIVSPGHEPFTNLQYQLKIGGIEVENLRRDTSSNIDLIIFLNQFEEIITQCHSPEAIQEREEMFAFLHFLSLKQDSTSRVIIIFTFRSDFLSPLANYEVIHNSKIFPLKSLDYSLNSVKWEECIKLIITKPALENGVTIDDELVYHLINEIKEVQGSLPILQFTLAQIWNEKTIQDRKIDSSEYLNISTGRGIAGIIENHAEKVIQRITRNGEDKEAVEIVKSIFLNLVEVVGSLSDVRRTVDKNELFNILKTNHSTKVVDKIFEDLVNEDGRLLMVTKDKDDKSKVDVIHEILIRKWGRLRSWIGERREALQYRKKIIQTIEDYHRGEDTLFTGKKLAIAKDWQKKNSDLSDDIIEKFIKASKIHSRKPLYKAAGIVILLIISYSLLELPFQQNRLKSFMIETASLKHQLDKAGGELSEVRELEITGQPQVLKKVAFFTNLESLTLSDFEVEDFEDLFGSKWGLQEVGSLTSLNLMHNDSIKSLKGFERLKDRIDSLSIENNNSLISLEGINGLRSIRSLNISKNRSLSDLRGLGKLPDLSFLTINENNNLVTLNEIENFSNLTFLELNGNSGSIALDPLKSLRNLERLKITYNETSKLEELQELSHLKYLELGSIDQLNDLQVLKNLKGLRSLVLRFNPQLSNLSGIEGLNDLKYLRLNMNNEALDLAGIGELTNLEFLEITHNQQLQSIHIDRVRRNNPGIEIVLK